jgi:hypothetical protein
MELQIGGTHMPHSRFSGEEISRLGRDLYEHRLRDSVEVGENIGKLIAIDVETGDYEIGDDRSLDAPRRLQARHPGAAIYTVRIGYNVVDSFGGVVERTAR